MVKIEIKDQEILKESRQFTKITNDAIDDLKTGKVDMTGFVNLPINYDKKEVESIINISNEIRKNAKVLVVIGIGGSYLGAKAAIDFLSGYYKKEEETEVIFVGNGLSEKYLKETLEYVEKKDFYINIISKSGGTLEPAVAFRVFRELAEKKYGENAKNRIIATTDKEKGILKELADKKGYRTFIVPDNIGGRYSVLTPVGLLPIAVAGFDVLKILNGAKLEREEIIEKKENNAADYAAIRNVLYNKDKCIEVFSTMTPNLKNFAEWLKQLFGESECKENKGIFPASLNLTADLHSMGQLMQEGKRNLFETFIYVEKEIKENNLKIENEKEDDDKLNYICGKTVSYLNEVALTATMKAHNDGGVPVLKITIDDFSEESLGRLFYFFMISCAISAKILGVNAFNQPGVEEYKKNIKLILKGE